MGSLTYNIDRILNRIPEVSRADVIEAINEIQQIVLAQDCYQTKKLTSNGLPPFLATTAGVYEYDCPADCRRTETIFVENYPQSRARSRPVGPRIEYYFKNLGYYKVGISSIDAVGSTLGKIYFNEDPGTTTDIYYHEYFIKPPVISDEGDSISLPDELHVDLRKAVIAMFTTEAYGQSGYDESTLKDLKRKVRNYLNRGPNGGPGITPVQEEYQDILTSFYRYRA